MGEDCLFSWGIDFRCGDGHPVIDLATGQVVNRATPITIGHHVWLGTNVSIMKGVNVGSNSVIGARAIVTRDVPSNCLAVGAPARVVRENVTWTRENLAAKSIPIAPPA